MFDDIIGDVKNKPKKLKKKRPRNKINVFHKGQTLGNPKKTRKQIEAMKKAMKIRKDLSDASGDVVKPI